MNMPTDTPATARTGKQTASVPQPDASLVLAYDFFVAEDYTSAIQELETVLRLSSPPAAARSLLAQCEVLRDLEQALSDAGNREARDDSINVLITTLEDKQGQPWLQEAESKAVRRLVNRGLLLARRFLDHVNYPLMRRWLEILHQALPWNKRVEEKYRAGEDLTAKVNISRTWVPPEESDDLLYVIANIKGQLELLADILQQSPNDETAQKTQYETIERYKEFLGKRNQRTEKLQKQADEAIAEERFRDARDALNDMLYLSGIGDPEDFEKLSPTEIEKLAQEFSEHRINVQRIQVQLRQARDLAEVAERARVFLDQVEDKLAAQEFAEARYSLRQVRGMELRGKPLSAEMSRVLSKARQKKPLSDAEKRKLEEARALCRESLVARRRMLDEQLDEQAGRTEGD